MTEMARILTRIKEAEENNQKKEEQVKAELAQYEQLKNNELIDLNKEFQERLTKLMKEKRKNEEEVTEDEQHKLELILEQFRQKVLEYYLIQRISCLSVRQVLLFFCWFHL